MQKNKNYNSTLIIIIICVLLYILDRFVFTNVITGDMEFKLEIMNVDVGSNPLFLRLFGFVFGKIYYVLAYPVNLNVAPKIWQPLTYLFMHQFIFHLIFNMLILGIVGKKIEQNIGSLKFLIIYFIIGILGLFIANGIVSTPAYAAGASISIFGLIGYELGYCLKHKEHFKDYSKKVKIFLILYGVIFTYLSGTWTIIAHNSGLILGLLIYFITEMFSKKYGFSKEQ